MTLCSHLHCKNFSPSYIMMLCTIWYHLYSLNKIRQKHPWRTVTFIIKIFISLWVFFTFSKLYKWYQIVQRVTYLFRSFLPRVTPQIWSTYLCGGYVSAVKTGTKWNWLSTYLRLAYNVLNKQPLKNSNPNKYFERNMYLRHIGHIDSSILESDGFQGVLKTSFSLKYQQLTL